MLKRKDANLSNPWKVSQQLFFALRIKLCFGRKEFGQLAQDRKKTSSKVFGLPTAIRSKKPIAFKTFEKARTKASLDEILAGVERYKRNLPQWQELAHPSAWLNHLLSVTTHAPI
jgi:hypothetical protein